MFGLTHFQAVLLGTLIVHLVLGLAIGAAPRDEPEPAPTMTMIKLDTRRPPPPPALKVEPPPPVPVTPPPPTRAPPPTTRRSAPRQVTTTTTPPPLSEPPPTTTTTTPAPGGAPVVTLSNVAPAAHGVAVAVGKPTDRRTGRGGSGGTEGEAVGAGTGSAVAKVVSVASIKKMAVPKGDYDYVSTKAYPAEAKQLGLGGVIRVQLTIDATGKVVKVRMLGKGLGHGLDELALTRARALAFEPALDTDDRPVASVLTFTFRFEPPA